MKNDDNHLKKKYLASEIQNYQADLRIDINRFENLLERSLKDLEEIHFNLKESVIYGGKNLC